MVNKAYSMIRSGRIKKLLLSYSLIHLFILSLILITGTKGYAQLSSFYNPFASISPYTLGNNTAGSFYSQPSFGSQTSYGGSQNPYGAATGNYYYALGSSTNNTNSYSTNSFYYPSSYGYSNQSYYSPATFGSASSGFYYPSSASSYNSTTGNYSIQNSFYNPGGSTYTNQSSFYYPGSGQTAQTNSFYAPLNNYYQPANNYYTAANSYYPPANTYYQTNAGGYVVNATTNLTGIWDGTWIRNFSAVGAPTSSRTSNSNMRSTNSTTTTTDHTSCSGGGGGGSANPITIELVQADAVVNGTVKFFEDNIVTQIPVSGTFINGVLDLSGTAPATSLDTATYGLQITATIEGTAIDGAYTVTNISTGANTEIGTFSAEK